MRADKHTGDNDHRLERYHESFSVSVPSSVVLRDWCHNLVTLPPQMCMHIACPRRAIIIVAQISCVIVQSAPRAARYADDALNRLWAVEWRWLLK